MFFVIERADRLADEAQLFGELQREPENELVEVKMGAQNSDQEWQKQAWSTARLEKENGDGKRSSKRGREKQWQWIYYIWPLMYK